MRNFKRNFILMIVAIAVSSLSHAAGTQQPTGQSANDRNLIEARHLYEKHQFPEAIALYKKIPSTYIYWVDSIEERAWAHLQLGQFESALALYHSLAARALSGEVGPETHLVGAIASLRLCDYKSVFDEMKLFKERFKPRIEALTPLTEKGSNEAVEEAAAKIRKGDPVVQFQTLSSKLPRYFAIDKKIRASAIANDNVAMQARVRELAEADLNEISGVVKKMHIIEIEAVQRMGLKRKTGEDGGKLASLDSDYISFPKDSEEWLDETQYRVGAKYCAKKVQK